MIDKAPIADKRFLSFDFIRAIAKNVDPRKFLVNTKIFLQSTVKKHCSPVNLNLESPVSKDVC